MESLLVGSVLHIARLQQELMFLSVYTVLVSPRTGLIFPAAVLSPHPSSIHPSMQDRAIHQGGRARPL